MTHEQMDLPKLKPSKKKRQVHPWRTVLNCSLKDYDESIHKLPNEFRLGFESDRPAKFAPYLPDDDITASLIFINLT